jgi:hypothetical protein
MSKQLQFDLMRALSEAQAAQYLGVSRSFLRQDRMTGPLAKGEGPPYVRIGRRKGIRYLVDDLDAYLQLRRVAVSPAPGRSYMGDSGLSRKSLGGVS